MSLSDFVGITYDEYCILRLLHHFDGSDTGMVDNGKYPFDVALLISKELIDATYTKRGTILNYTKKGKELYDSIPHQTVLDLLKEKREQEYSY